MKIGDRVRSRLPGFNTNSFIYGIVKKLKHSKELGHLGEAVTREDETYALVFWTHGIKNDRLTYWPIRELVKQ